MNPDNNSAGLMAAPLPRSRGASRRPAPVCPGDSPNL